MARLVTNPLFIFLWSWTHWQGNFRVVFIQIVKENVCQSHSLGVRMHLSFSNDSHTNTWNAFPKERKGACKAFGETAQHRNIAICKFLFSGDWDFHMAMIYFCFKEELPQYTRHEQKSVWINSRLFIWRSYFPTIIQHNEVTCKLNKLNIFLIHILCLTAPQSQIPCNHVMKDRCCYKELAAETNYAEK